MSIGIIFLVFAEHLYVQFVQCLSGVLLCYPCFAQGMERAWLFIGMGMWNHYQISATILFSQTGL